MYKFIYENSKPEGVSLEFVILSLGSFGIDEENWDTYIFKDIQLVCAKQVVDIVCFLYCTSSL